MLLKILLLILIVYFTGSVVYMFVFTMAGKLFYKRGNFGKKPFVPHHSIAILVPAFKEDDIIISTVRNLLQSDYPADLFDIYIIADSFRRESLEKLALMKIFLFEVSFDKSTKTKALNEAFSRINKVYDIALICDADNVLAKDFLLRIDNAFSGGAQAVQGCRVAKNLDSSFSILDACSEGINNNIFRKGANALGLASPVIGSGMAFDFEMVKRTLSKIHAVGGFDKVLQLDIVQRSVSILYLEDALIFDEKVGTSVAFEQQRKRWISSQMIYLKRFMYPGIRELFRGNISYFNLAVANNLILPRAFLVLLAPLLVLLTYLIRPDWMVFISATAVILFLSLLLAVPVNLMNKSLLKAVLSLPKALFLMLGTVLHVRKADQTFIHTVHTKTEITNPFYKEEPDK